MDEKPVSLKKSSKKKKQNKNSAKCIIHFSSVDSTDEIGKLTEITWNKINK